MRPVYLLFLFCSYACNTENTNTKAPDWSKNLVLYELMPWHNSIAKNLDSVASDVRRINSIFFNGIVLHPPQVRDVNNNGYNPNSQFALSDLSRVDERLGGSKSLLRLLDSCKAYKIKALLQWDFSQTGPHHKWRTSHPEYYNSSDEQVEGRYNKDYIRLNLENESCRQQQIDIFLNFIKKFPFDGVILYGLKFAPDEFSTQLFNKTMKIRHMLLIDASREEYSPFHYQSNNRFFNIVHEIYNDSISTAALSAFLDSSYTYPAVNAFINYETNVTKGTDYNLFPNASKYYIMLSYMVAGIPWVLNGQEYSLLEPINVFNDKPFGRLYKFNLDLFRSLNLQKLNNIALGSYPNAGKLNIISSSTDVLAVERINENQFCVGLFNLRARESVVVLNKSYENAYDVFNKIPVTYPKNTELKLGPYQAVLFSNVP